MFFKIRPVFYIPYYIFIFYKYKSTFGILEFKTSQIYKYKLEYSANTK